MLLLEKTAAVLLHMRCGVRALTSDVSVHVLLHSDVRVHVLLH